MGGTNGQSGRAKKKLLFTGTRSHTVSQARGPVILLIHGMAGSSRTWDSVIPLLAKDHTVIAPDMLGHGESEKPQTDYSLGAFACGLRDLLRILSIEQATVVGQSLGGGVALQLAYQHPEFCERLVPRRQWRPRQRSQLGPSPADIAGCGPPHALSLPFADQELWRPRC